MGRKISRRKFIAGASAAAGAAGAVSALSGTARGAEDVPTAPGTDVPLVDFHVHRDGTTVEKLLEISKARGVKFGIVEHAGLKENKYPIIYSNDEELKGYIASLEGKPVYKGVQAEYLDWMTCFSKEAVAQLDYVLSDAMTIRGPGGARLKMWEKGFAVGEPQEFMDRYAEFHAEVMALEPLDILANPTWMPEALAKDYDALWTEARNKKIIDAALKYNVAIEINSQYCVPRLPFLKLAKAAGVKFSFGSNIRGPNVGKLDYCVEMIKTLGLTRADMFTPAPPGKKPIQLRK
ncbi:MAG: twin-arginine translocation signal domain-containing protein [Planctomycetota bacterium]